MGGIDMDFAAIGRRIRRIRIAKGITQEKLAEYASISTVYMSHIETESAKPSLSVLVRIAEALDVRVDSLLYDQPKGGASIAVDEIAAVLESCDAAQAQFIADIVKAAKQSLDMYDRK